MEGHGEDVASWLPSWAVDQLNGMPAYLDDLPHGQAPPHQHQQQYHHDQPEQHQHPKQQQQPQHESAAYDDTSAYFNHEWDVTWTTSSVDDVPDFFDSEGAMDSSRDSSVSPPATSVATSSPSNDDATPSESPSSAGSAPTPASSASSRATMPMEAYTSIMFIPPADNKTSPAVKHGKKTQPKIKLQDADSMDEGDLLMQDVAETPLSLGPKKPRKTAHNVVEQRYRNNLNDRINDLKMILPDLSQSEKSNKGGILKRAYEYISRLQHLNGQLVAENQRLRNALIAAGSNPNSAPAANAARASAAQDNSVYVLPRTTHFDERIRLAMVVVMVIGVWYGPSALMGAASVQPLVAGSMRSLLFVNPASSEFVAPVSSVLYYAVLISLGLSAVFIDHSAAIDSLSGLAAPSFVGKPSAVWSWSRVVCATLLEMARLFATWITHTLFRWQPATSNADTAAATVHMNLALRSLSRDGLTGTTLHLLRSVRFAVVATGPSGEFTASQCYFAAAVYALHRGGDLVSPIARSLVHAAASKLSNQSSSTWFAMLLARGDFIQFVLDSTPGNVAAAGVASTVTVTSVIRHVATAFVMARLGAAHKLIQSNESPRQIVSELQPIVEAMEDPEMSWWCSTLLFLIGQMDLKPVSPLKLVPPKQSSNWFGETHQVLQQSIVAFGLLHRGQIELCLRCCEATLSILQTHSTAFERASSEHRRQLYTAALMSTVSLLMRTRLLALLSLLSLQQKSPFSARDRFASSFKLESQALQNLAGVFAGDHAAFAEVRNLLAIHKVVYRDLRGATLLRTEGLLRIPDNAFLLSIAQAVRGFLHAQPSKHISAALSAAMNSAHAADLQLLKLCLASL